jgi:hypothetical protein
VNVRAILPLRSCGASEIAIAAWVLQAALLNLPNTDFFPRNLPISYLIFTMFDGAAEIVIQGITAAGDKFRPSDWAERLCGMMSVFGEDRQLSYSPFLKPVTIAGTTCVVVDRKLERLDAAAYRFLMSFARDNELMMRPGRMEVRPEPSVV